MTFVNGQVPQGVRDAAVNDGPAFLVRNALSDTVLVPPFFNTGGLSSSTDLDDPDFTGDYVRDYQLETGARAAAANVANVWYMNFELNSAVVDAVAIKLSSLPSGTWDISVQLSVSGNFTGVLDVATIASFTGVTNTNRLVDPTLNWPENSNNDGDRRFTNVRYGRLVMNRQDAGNTTSPHVGEFFIGQQQVLSRPWQSGFDDAPQGWTGGVFRSAARKVIRYVYARGFADQDFQYRSTGVEDGDLYGLDDLATIRLIQDESLSGSRPVWKRDRTSGVWRLGHFEGEGIEVPIQSGEFSERGWDVGFSELPPFAAREA